MVVVKRQRRGKPLKIEQRKPRGPQLKQTALQASPIYIQQGQARREKKHIKRGAKIEPGLLFASFGSTWPHTLRMYFPLLSK